MEVALTVALFLTHFDIHLLNHQSNDSHNRQATLNHICPEVKRQVSSELKSTAAAHDTPSGDPHGLLPLPETRRQVGIRWPQTRCDVIYEALQK